MKGDKGTVRVVSCPRTRFFSRISPDDFYVLHRQGKNISRDAEEAWPKNNPELMAINQKQVRELFTRYGPIDVFFIDSTRRGCLI